MKNEPHRISRVTMTSKEIRNFKLESGLTKGSIVWDSPPDGIKCFLEAANGYSVLIQASEHAEPGVYKLRWHCSESEDVCGIILVRLQKASPEESQSFFLESSKLDIPSANEERIELPSEAHENSLAKAGRLEPQSSSPVLEVNEKKVASVSLNRSEKPDFMMPPGNYRISAKRDDCTSVRQLLKLERGKTYVIGRNSDRGLVDLDITPLLAPGGTRSLCSRIQSEVFFKDDYICFVNKGRHPSFFRPSGGRDAFPVDGLMFWRPEDQIILPDNIILSLERY